MILQAFWKQGFIVEIQRMLPKSYITLSKTDTWKNEELKKKWIMNTNKHIFLDL